MTKYSFKKTFIFKQFKDIDFDAVEDILNSIENELLGRSLDTRIVFLPDVTIKLIDGKVEVFFELELTISPLSPLANMEAKLAEEIANEFFKRFKTKF